MAGLLNEVFHGVGSPRPMCGRSAHWKAALPLMLGRKNSNQTSAANRAPARKGIMTAMDIGYCSFCHPPKEAPALLKKSSRGVRLIGANAFRVNGIAENAGQWLRTANIPLKLLIDSPRRSFSAFTYAARRSRRMPRAFEGCGVAAIAIAHAD
jgi:hypothetical protein